jgi:hypothetical protein
VLYVQYISSQFYDPTGEALAETVYRILDPLLVLGMIIVVYYAYQRKLAVDAASDDSVTREYLEANGVLYLSVALFVGLLWNWVGFQFSNPTNSEGWLWALIDLALPLLFYASSVQLLKKD